MFSYTKEELEQYRLEVMRHIKADRMNLMANGRIMLWVDEELAKFDKGKPLNNSEPKK